MKNLTKSIAKINVLKCEEKIHNETKRQDFDKDGNLLWTVNVKEEVFNEEFNVMEIKIAKYKTLEELPLGEHIVELKVSSMGEGSGNFVKVNSFFTILRSISADSTLKDMFSIQGTIPPSKRKLTAKTQPVAQ